MKPCLAAISDMPALANLFGTVKRVAMGVTLEGKERSTAADLRDVGELLAFLRQPEPPRGLSEAWELLPLAKTVMGMRPKIVKTAPVQEVVLTGDDTKTLPVAIASFGGEDISLWSVSAAGAVGIMLPIVIIMLLLQRNLVRGLTAGAVKG